MQLQNPESFTMFRSVLIFSLGFGGLGCFAVSYFALWCSWDLLYGMLFLSWV